MLLSVPHFVFLDAMPDHFITNAPFQDKLTQVTSNPGSHPGFHLRDGLLFFNDRVWLEPGNPFIVLLMEEFHSTPLGGHLGFAKTLHRLQMNFHWANMRANVNQFIRQCTTCQPVKYEPKKLAGLLHPLLIPTSPWQDLSLDFITGLPPSKGYTAVLVVIDRFSKGAYFGALLTHYTANKVALIFLDIVCKHHGFTRSLVSDRDLIFIGHFWRDLFTLSGTKLRMSITYHPETDDQTEVLNRTLEQYLRCFVHDTPSKWSQFLSLAEWCYNTAVHSATGITPFEATYDKPSPSLATYFKGRPLLRQLIVF